MALTIMRTEPCQEIAADSSTIDDLTASVRARLTEVFGTTTSKDIGSMYGFPLVVDESVPAGRIHFRPFSKGEDA